MFDVLGAPPHANGAKDTKSFLERKKNTSFANVHNSQKVTKGNSGSNKEIGSKGAEVVLVVQNKVASNFHYSDITNRRFQPKFINHLSKTNVGERFNETTPVGMQQVKDLDISYSEVIVGSAKTLHSSDLEDEDGIEIEYESISDRIQKVSDLLSELSFSPGSFVDLSRDSNHV